MTDQPMKVVWLFGSGLSKPLGGPLLNELFSPRYVAIAQGLLPHEGQTAVEEAAAAYEVLVANQLVVDAEDFLNVLDTACEDGNPLGQQCRSILSKLAGQRFQIFSRTYHFSGAAEERAQLLHSARLQIALACESFVPENPEDTLPESWAPLRRWRRDLLEAQDTIVTFNYDRAVERAGEEKVWPLLPGTRDILRAQELNQEGALLLKLHGSVDWWKEDVDHVAHVKGSARARLLDADDLSKLAIGIPGPGKSNLSARFLRPLWDKAREALESADAVVIVGYRMPDTDGNAMELITNSLRENAKSGTHPMIHLVLGPDIDSEDHKRLSGYLENIVGRGFIKRWSAWGEGFFSTVRDRDQLLSGV